MNRIKVKSSLLAADLPCHVERIGAHTSKRINGDFNLLLVLVRDDMLYVKLEQTEQSQISMFGIIILDLCSKQSNDGHIYLFVLVGDDMLSEAGTNRTIPN